MPRQKATDGTGRIRASEREIIEGQGLKGDPDRRLRIIEAAIEVVATRGIEGVTHRAVAEVAGVPLGSTTYYFKDKDELILAAMVLIGDRNVTRLRELLENYKARGFDVVEALTALTEELNIRRLDVLVVEYRFYLAPLNRVELHAASVAVQSDWYSILDEYLSEHVDPVTASALAYTFEGIAIRAVALGEGPSAEAIAPIYRRIVQQSVESGRKAGKKVSS